MSILIDIASYVPAGRLDNLPNCERFAIEPDFLDHKIGTRQVARMSAEEDASTMAVEAFRRLMQKTDLPPEKISCVMVCTQNPAHHGIPHTSAAVHREMKLADQVACFDISLGCSGFVYGLSVLAAFLEYNELDYGVLLTSDPYSPILDPDDKNTTLLFGDAATATLVTRRGDVAGWEIGKFAFSTRGHAGQAINNASGQLAMNGRAVFEFCLKEVPGQIRSLLSGAGLQPEQIDACVLHQGSKFIVDQIGRATGFRPDQVPLGLEGIGNTVSSSIPLVLEKSVLGSGARRVLLSGFGVGLSWASCLLERKLSS